jgi:hypothetical protein
MTSHIARDAEPAYVVRWRDDATLRDRLEARNVWPEGAFSRELLAQADGEHLIYDGRTITLDVDNGRWVWEVTGQNDDGSVIYGRWPD